MVGALKLIKSQPLITIGDAIRTFLSDLPLTSQGHPKDTFTEDGKLYWAYAIDAPSKRRRWVRTVQRRAWVIGIGLCLGLEISATAFLAMSLQALPLSVSEQEGFGAVSPRSFSEVDSDSMAVLSLVSNTPQILVSIVYITYYSLISTMLTNAEGADFAKRPRTLRVTSPRHGQQRSTYWLKALFVIRINRIDLNGEIYYNTVNGVGWFSVAIVAAMAWGVGIILLPIVLGLRTLPNGAPDVDLYSMAIASACVPHTDNEEGLAEKPLVYGVFRTPDHCGVYRCGFGSIACVMIDSPAPKSRWKLFGTPLTWRDRRRRGAYEEVEMEVQGSEVGDSTEQVPAATHDNDDVQSRRAPVGSGGRDFLANKPLPNLPNRNMRDPEIESIG